MISDTLTSITLRIGEGFFLGLLSGWALKKVIKLLAIVVGLFLVGLAYLQYQQLLSINWQKLEQVSEGVIITIANAAMNVTVSRGQNEIFPNITNLGIPLIGGLSAGLAIGFIKG